MKYSVQAHRRYGKYLEKVSVVKNESNVPSGTNAFAQLTSWVTFIMGQNSTSWETGDTVYDTFVSVNDTKTGNTGSKADVKLTIVGELEARPILLQMEVKDCTQSDFASKAGTEFYNAYGYQWSSPYFGIMSATVILHD